MHVRIFLTALSALAVPPALAAPPSLPPADSPELAALGPAPAGVRTLQLAAADRRPLRVVIWYPARRSAGATPTSYPHRMTPAPPLAPVDVVFEGIAIRDAPIGEGRHPLVILSHGFGGWPEAMSFLAENLATKGYVVAGIDHGDLPFTDAASFQLSFAQTAARRARDQQAVLDGLFRSPLAASLDPARVGLIGYSMGGFGALATAGAGYDPQSPAMRALPPGTLAGQLQGDRRADPRIKAVVAFAPWGAQDPHRSWSAQGLGALTTPLLLLAGSDDDISGDGPARLFGMATRAPRILVTFGQARHNIGANPSPEAARGSFKLRESFDEPVWRTDRLNAISQHMVTAFLDVHLKGDARQDRYLTPALPGFQPRWALGITLQREQPRN